MTVLYDGEALTPAALGRGGRLVYVELEPDGTVADVVSLSADFQCTEATLALAAEPGWPQPRRVLTVTGASTRSVPSTPFRPGPRVPVAYVP